MDNTVVYLLLKELYYDVVIQLLLLCFMLVLQIGMVAGIIIYIRRHRG